MAKRNAQAAQATATGTVKVRLLVSRTNVGEIGAVVEYDAELAARHVSLGLAAYDPPADTDGADDDDVDKQDPPKE